MKKWAGWLAAALFLITVLASGRLLGHNYAGTDVKVAQVIGQYAPSLVAGTAAPPNTGPGDLLLFLFAASGVTGGFYLGYKWREIFGPADQSNSDRGGTGNDA